MENRGGSQQIQIIHTWPWDKRTWLLILVAEFKWNPVNPNKTTGCTSVFYRLRHSLWRLWKPGKNSQHAGPKRIRVPARGFEWPSLSAPAEVPRLLIAGLSRHLRSKPESQSSRVAMRVAHRVLWNAGLPGGFPLPTKKGVHKLQKLRYSPMAS